MMSITNVSAAQASVVAANAKPTQTKAETKTEATTPEVKPTETTATSNEAAVYEPSKKTNAHGTYDAAKVKQMVDEVNNQADKFRDLFMKLISKQATKDAIASGGSLSGDDAFKSIMSKIDNGGEAMVEIDEETRLQAQKDVAEGGYFSVEKTGDRLLEFADAMAGGDPKKLELMRKSVQDGFKAAEEMWGGELPQISKDTLAYVMKGFDDRAAKSTSATKNVAAN